jgi:hypothetical protein
LESAPRISPGSFEITDSDHYSVYFLGQRFGVVGQFDLVGEIA